MLAAKGVRMGCFCHASLAPLRLALPQLNVSATLSLPGAPGIFALSGWLSALGLPAAPWAPEPAWLGLKLPTLMLNARAVATISALASLRAQVLAQFGLDLLNPAHAAAFARIVATLNARLAAMAGLNFNPSAWIGLANLMTAIEQIQLALTAGLFAPSPGLLLALGAPGGIPMPRWSAFLAALRALAPMLAAVAQLNVSLSETAQLSAALRLMARLVLPVLPMPHLQLMASLSAALSAVARLQLSLGVSPLALGLPAVTLRVQARLAALLPGLGIRLGPANLLAEALAALLALLPKLPVVPTGFATAAVVQAALQARAVAALNWQVPAMLPAIAIGLPVCNFAAQLQAALNITAVLPAPCASGCDAARLARALA